MASSASDITETSQEFASGKNITSDQKAKKPVSSRASPDETATINTTNSNLGPSNEISKSAEENLAQNLPLDSAASTDRLASTTVSATEMSSEIDYYDLSEKTPEEKEQLRERLKKLIENTEAILDITSSTKSRANGGVSTTTTIVPSVTEESALTEQTRVIPEETTVKVEGTTVQETTANTAILTTTSTVTTTVSSTTTTEAQGNSSLPIYVWLRPSHVVFHKIGISRFFGGFPAKIGISSKIMDFRVGAHAEIPVKAP